MAITFEHGGDTYKADTPEEAATLIAFLDKRASAIARRRQLDSAFSKAFLSHPRVNLDVAEHNNPWTPVTFSRFIERLGIPQQTALGALIMRRIVEDEQLRNVVGAKNNQALAGILSGISKQSLAVGVSPRAIFTFSNLRSGGKRKSTYEVADEFRQIAREMDWPPAAMMLKLQPANA
jgi:hypothetical protein